MVTAHQLPYLFPYFLSLAASVGVLVYLWRRRFIDPAMYYAAVIVWEILTTVAYIFEISSESLADKIFWDDVQWLTLCGEAISLLVFALHFVQSPPKRAVRIYSALLIPPVLFFGALVNPQWHGLVRANAYLIPGDPFSALYYDFTPLSYAVSTYLLGAAFTTLILLGIRLIKAGPLYRGQIATVLAGIFIPTATGLLTLAGVKLSFQRDVMPISFGISNVIVAYGLFRYRLFDVAPIARETVFESMGEAVIVLDTFDRIVDLNPAARLLMTNRDADWIGKRFEEALAQWFPSGGDFQIRADALPQELLINTEEGTRNFGLRVSPIHTAQGLHIGWALLLRDITERKRAEAALIEHTRELEEARTAAEKANKVKSQFLASMSHELRTPLNAILNFTQFVSSGLYGPINEKQHEALEKSTSSARHLLMLINDVLDMSKIEAGGMELALETDIDLNEEIQAVADMVLPLLPGKPVELVISPAPDLPPIVGDRRRIRQILLNLMANAAKFTERGTIHLQVQLEGDQIVVSVEDTGPGIALEELEAIFEPFRQTAESRKRSGGGTGLGLPISRRLAEAHGGSLRVDSTPGKGSAFFLSLPVRGADWAAKENHVKV